MLSRRLIRKLEVLIDEDHIFLEQQVDKLLAMPGHCRTRAAHLHLVNPHAMQTALDLHRVVAASHDALTSAPAPALPVRPLKMRMARRHL